MSGSRAGRVRHESGNGGVHGSGRRSRGAGGTAGTGRRPLAGRRLTLAPATQQALRPSSLSVVSDDEDVDEDRQCAEGRAACLSRVVSLAVEASRRPKPIHVVPDQAEAIQSKFWAQPGVQDDLDDDEPSTPEFINEAEEAGFSFDQLLRAERALHSGNEPRSTDIRLSKHIVSTLVQRKIGTGAPWQGPLTSPRVSPPRTLGDCLATASVHRGSRQGRTNPSRISSTTNSWRGPRPPQVCDLLASSHELSTELVEHTGKGSPARMSPARSSPTPASATSLKFFEILNPQVDPIFPPFKAAKLPADDAACLTCSGTEKADQGILKFPKKIVLGPGKIFRPTQGLCALFRRTGIRKKPYLYRRLHLPRARRREGPTRTSYEEGRRWRLEETTMANSAVGAGVGIPASTLGFVLVSIRVLEGGGEAAISIHRAAVVAIMAALATTVATRASAAARALMVLVVAAVAATGPTMAITSTKLRQQGKELTPNRSRSRGPDKRR